MKKKKRAKAKAKKKRKVGARHAVPLPSKKKTVLKKKKLKSIHSRPKVVKSKVQKKPVAPPEPEKPAKKKNLIRELKRQRKLRDKERKGEAELTRDQTPMRIYLDQIEKIPLFTAKQELEVAFRVISKEKEEASVARELMIRSNLRLVISIAKRYSNLGLTFSDLVEEGNIGLMRAVDKFDPHRGYRFSTYASWWIKQAIMRALSNQGKTIRIPVYMFDIVSRYRKVRDELIQRYGRIPTRQEISQVLKIPVQKVGEIEGVVNRPSSLNATVSMDGQAELIDLIEDDSFETPLQETEDLFKSQRIQQVLKILDDRERRIIHLRYGLGTDEPHTLEETAKQFGITRERVRQIEAQALKKVRYHMAIEADKPEDYLSS